MAISISLWMQNFDERSIEIWSTNNRSIDCSGEIVKTRLIIQSIETLFCTNPARADGSPTQWCFDPPKRGQLFGYFDSPTNEPTSIWATVDPEARGVWHAKLRSVGKHWNLGRIMNESLFGSPLFASALFGVAMFFFFRWVFVERYSAEEAKNYAILIAFVCAVITWGAFS